MANIFFSACFGVGFLLLLLCNNLKKNVAIICSCINTFFFLSENRRIIKWLGFKETFEIF